MKIMVCGDVHGNFGILNKFLNKEKPDILLACGDFGYWPNFYNKTYIDNVGQRRTWHAEIKNPNTRIYWCDGNHEDFDTLEKRETDELWPNVWYMPRGKVMQLPDGRNVMFFGGAYSVDKKYRTAGYDWFPQEMITLKDLQNLPDMKIDIFVTHTAPKCFNVKYQIIGDKINDPCRDALQVLFDRYRPTQWFFGHLHRFQRGTYKDCQWTVLAHNEADERWYVDITL